MNTYQVELNWPEKDKATWVIRGLKDTHPYDGTTDEDTILWGMDNAKDPEHYVAGEICSLYGALYDTVNTNPEVRDGDIFDVQAAEVPLYHTYDRKAQRFAIPAMRFRRDGVHAVPADDETAAILEAAHNQIKALERAERFEAAGW